MFDRPLFKRSAITAAIAVGLAGSFVAGTVFAADARLDEANASLIKAAALLQAATNPGVRHPFGGHRTKAVRLVQQAERQITLAQKYADNPHNKPKPKPKPKGHHH
jgi:hypothetical protein